MKQKIKAIVVMLVLVGMVATVPPVSAAAETLSTADDEDIYVITNYNHTAADLQELLDISLDEKDTLYISYYNETAVLTHGSISPHQDSKDIVWWDIDFTTINLTIHCTNKQFFFDDEIITAANYDEKNTGLFADNHSYAKDKYFFIVTIPDGVEFEYDDRFFSFDDNNITVKDSKDKEIGNMTSYEYNSTFGVYSMNLSDDDGSHQIVIYDSDIHQSSTALTAKRVTVKSWWIDTTTTYSVNTESVNDYNVFSSEDGYLSYNVFMDYAGFLGKYTGGKKEFKMTEDTWTYNTNPSWKFWNWNGVWTEITTHECGYGGIDQGLIEYIWISEDTGEEDNNEILKDNWGVITSKGEATTVSGFDIFRMLTSRTPEAIVDLSKTLFS